MTTKKKHCEKRRNQHFLLFAKDFPAVFSHISDPIIWAFPKGQILDSSKLKQYAGDNFKFDENGRMFSKQLENAVGKGEIAHYEQFLLFQQCFQKICTADT